MGFQTIVRKIKLKERDVRILLLGLDNAGKTTILKSMTGDDVQQVEPTLGFHIQTVDFSGFKLHIWDVGGQTCLRPFWRNYFEETEGLVWVCDAADRLRLSDAKALLHSVLQDQKLEGASLLIFLNKSDLEGCLTISELYSILDLASIEASHRVHLLSCSAIRGENIHQGFGWIANEIKSRLYTASA